MCGIFGFFHRESLSKRHLDNDSIDKIIGKMNHRGPDQSGIWIDEANKLGLGHVRLSIQDLSDAGRQPMVSQCGRFLIVFNGEIYNFKNIKADLNKNFTQINWLGNSDTEVLLNALIYFGVEETLTRLNGMFALAFLDIQNQKIFLARDRFGEKPLYIYSNQQEFCFSSELRAIEATDVPLTLNPLAVDSLLTYSYIAAPMSIFREVFKFPAGNFLEINLSNEYKKIDIDSCQPYWCLSNELNADIEKPISFSEALIQTENRLISSVTDRMISDVPFGAFLSGGIDSTAIVAMMQKVSSRPIKTFTIGFTDEHYNEARHAKSVANHLGTEHYELYLHERDMLSVVPTLSQIFDEPFADSSQLPTYMVSKFARDHVTVALTGDAGDEFFGGYNRYYFAPKLFQRMSPVPLILRRFATLAGTSISPKTFDRILEVIAKFYPSGRSVKRFGDKIHKLSHATCFSSQEDLYGRLIKTSVKSLTNSNVQKYSENSKTYFERKDLSFAEKMMCADIVGYMQNDILTKVDRASMAVSLETRVPFLDNELVQFALSLPENLKIHQGTGKYLLRELVKKYVPSSLIEREKSGFGVPIYDWLRSELREWAESLLTEDKLSLTGLLDVDRIRRLWASHLSGYENNQYAIWNVLMFQSWLADRNWQINQ